MCLIFLVDGDGSFSIEADSGIIRTKKELDREKVASYRLVVVATDQGENPLNTSVNVYVNLEDIQDSKPIFKHKLYNFTIEENSNVQVGQVTATLADETFQDTMMYSISKNVHNLFSIDRRRGVIQVTQALDYEKQRIYVLEVRVSVSSGLTDKTVVHVEVEDVNDHPPVLEDFYIFLNVINGVFDPIFKIPATDVDVTSVMSYSILKGNDHKFVTLAKETGELYLQKSIVNTATEIEITVEVHDGNFRAHAIGRISVSEVSTEMVENSIFIVLNGTSRNTFLRTSVLTKFKRSLARVFRCNSGLIFILSIEDFKHTLSSNENNIATPMLEVAIAVRQELKSNYLPSKRLKDLLYLNQKAFEDTLDMKLISFDFWNEYFCGAESCSDFESCTLTSTDTKNKSNTIKSRYVIFRGINVQPKLLCTCPIGYRNGPDSAVSCTESYSLCYSKPCGNHGTCLSTDIGFTCTCNPGYQGNVFVL